MRKVEIKKPAVKPNESEADYVARCIPWVIRNEGLDSKQAAGKCYGMYRGKENKKIYKLELDKLTVPKEKMEKFEQAQSKYEMGIYTAPDDFEIDGVEIKKGQELHYVLGVVLEPETVDATRTDETVGDIYSEDEVRKAAHYFLANYKGRGNDFMHDGSSDKDLKIVESYIAPVDMELNKQKVKKGSWLMGTLILDNEIWNKVKKGEITGYSIGGKSNAKIEVAETV